MRTKHTKAATRAATLDSSSVLRRYALAAGSVVKLGLGANHASAAIIYTDLMDEKIPLQTFFEVDIDGGGADLRYYWYENVNFVPNPPFAVTADHYAEAGGVGGTVLATAASRAGWVDRLEADAMVGSNLSFDPRFVTNLTLADNDGKGVNRGTGNWYAEGGSGTQTGFIGVQLDSGNYGWVRISVEDYSEGLDVTVHDYAYDDSGAAIAAGAGAVPEPAGMSLLASGAAGTMLRRRRKA